VTPLVLVAHGSRDPRSAATVRRLARAVRAAWPAPVAAAFLDFNLPAVAPTVRALAVESDHPPVVVPALLTHAYHGRVDLPQLLAASGAATRLAPVLGPAAPGEEPDPLLLAALRRRLSELDRHFDGVALVAAGTRDLAARSTVDSVASALSVVLALPCVAGFAAGGPTGADAVAAVRAHGARRILAASYFLAPGRLHSAVAASARAAGAFGVAAPLGAAAELVDLVTARAHTARAHYLSSLSSLSCDLG
jgi:sirohydrochlorin ferrochelatase